MRSQGYTHHKYKNKKIHTFRVQIKKYIEEYRRRLKIRLKIHIYSLMYLSFWAKSIFI